MHGAELCDQLSPFERADSRHSGDFPDFNPPAEPSSSTISYRAWRMAARMYDVSMIRLSHHSSLERTSLRGQLRPASPASTARIGLC
jgi:hypothetical protein